ncbi:A/G-specific adenine glycosylase [Chlamydia trachomatis]|nr:A/G-specific adenine glycosylase [Chlamydia trachomatis]ROT52173.1 A/G-specific adenine glycosylase [Chlamydia trachomatis]ROT57832.1 A/G-specific adenine glycosylase [Chlamydia trachomatis]
MIRTAFFQDKECFPLEALRSWFLESKRSFPWRDSPTPYRVWVSEVMLQQTRAEVVVPYFLKWMERFPTLQDLAQARESDVVQLWEGLGYYSRARNLLAGARVITEIFGGEIPNDLALLSSIKGIGSYTANAILAFAFKQKNPAVDGNVLRVMSRLFAIEESIDRMNTRREITGLCESLLPDQDPQVIAESFIELGARICKKQPLCEQCPLRSFCTAYRQGTMEQYPVRNTRAAISRLFRAVVIVLYKDQVLMTKREEKEIMAGLYEFPYYQLPKEDCCDIEKITHLVQKDYGETLHFVSSLPSQKQVFTRYRVTLFPHVFYTKYSLPNSYTLAELSSLPSSSGHRRIKETFLVEYHKSLEKDGKLFWR